MRPSGPYKTYRFITKDPVIDQLHSLIEDDDLLAVSEASGVAIGTLRNWFRGTTQRPMHATAKAVARACGYDLKLVKGDA